MTVTEEMRVAMTVARNYQRMHNAAKDAENAIMAVLSTNTSDHFLDDEDGDILEKAQAIVAKVQGKTTEYNAEQYLRNIQL